MAEKERVIALGFFDGLHIGHAALMRKTLEVAEKKNITSSVMSFDVHPDTLVKKDNPVRLISDAVGREDLIKRLFGIENVIFIHFDEKTMRMPWDVFIETLTSELSAVHLVVGHDFRFGYKGQGDAELLERYCREMGIGLDVIPGVTRDGVVVSSSHIRELLENGEMERANELLGHPHTLLDTVRYGHKLGRRIGTPTINMAFPPGVLVPKHGVYATKVSLEDGEYAAVTNIGVRPTVSGDSAVSVESYILDFDRNLYGHKVRVDFYKYLRPEIRFENIEALKDQIRCDCEASRKFFADI